MSREQFIGHQLSGYHGLDIMDIARLAQLWVQCNRTRNHLRMLDESRLKDIGLSAAAAQEEAGKFFWQA